MGSPLAGWVPQLGTTVGSSRLDQSDFLLLYILCQELFPQGSTGGEHSLSPGGWSSLRLNASGASASESGLQLKDLNL